MIVECSLVDKWMDDELDDASVPEMGQVYIQSDIVCVDVVKTRASDSVLRGGHGERHIECFDKENPNRVY